MKVQKTRFTTFCHTQMHLTLQTENFFLAATTVHLAPFSGRLYRLVTNIIKKN